MKTISTPLQVSERLYIRQVPPARSVPDLVSDVRRGLFARPRSLPPKYFYDGHGSQLFDQICDTPEYYPTRTEDALLRRHAREIIELIRPSNILELGSGASRKTRHLIDACDRHDCLEMYSPFDVCQEILMSAGQTLTEDYQWLKVSALVGDYLAGLDHLPCDRGIRLFVFLGGTIGNFTREDSVSFLRELRGHMRDSDYLLLGADRVKDTDVLNSAYNDSQGITAKFNLNVLSVLNRALDADFREDAFRHQAFYNAPDEQIEMYLVSNDDQRVHLAAIEETIDFVCEERILTEISRKFTFTGVQDMLDAACFSIVRHFEADNAYYSLVLARPG